MRVAVLGAAAAALLGGTLAIAPLDRPAPRCARRGHAAACTGASCERLASVLVPQAGPPAGPALAGPPLAPPAPAAAAPCTAGPSDALPAPHPAAAQVIAPGLAAPPGAPSAAVPGLGVPGVPGQPRVPAYRRASIPGLPGVGIPGIPVVTDFPATTCPASLTGLRADRTAWSARTLPRVRSARSRAESSARRASSPA